MYDRIALTLNSEVKYIYVVGVWFVLVCSNAY